MFLCESGQITLLGLKQSPVCCQGPPGQRHLGHQSRSSCSPLRLSWKISCNIPRLLSNLLSPRSVLPLPTSRKREGPRVPSASCQGAWPGRQCINTWLCAPQGWVGGHLLWLESQPSWPGGSHEEGGQGSFRVSAPLLPRVLLQGEGGGGQMFSVLGKERKGLPLKDPLVSSPLFPGTDPLRQLSSRLLLGTRDTPSPGGGGSRCPPLC